MTLKARIELFKDGFLIFRTTKVAFPCSKMSREAQIILKVVRLSIRKSGHTLRYLERVVWMSRSFGNNQKLNMIIVSIRESIFQKCEFFQNLTWHCAREKWLFLARKIFEKVSDCSESLPNIFSQTRTCFKIP